MRMTLGTGLLTAVLVLMVAAPALAKLPPFSVEVAVDDLVATVTVTLDQVAGYIPPDAFDGAVGILPASSLTDGWRAASPADVMLPVLEATEDETVFVGSVVLPVEGEYVAVPFPFSHEAPPFLMYGGPVPFSTASADETSLDSTTLVGAAVAAITVLVAGAWLGARSRRLPET